MTRLRKPPVISFDSDDVKFYVDERKGLQRQFPPVFPRPLFGEAGEWQVDSVAERAPWRSEIERYEKLNFRSPGSAPGMGLRNHSLRLQAR